MDAVEMVERTYESFRIVWARGSSWSGYETAPEAQAVVDFAGRAGEVGEVVGSRFSVSFPAAHAWLYRPGVVGTPKDQRRVTFQGEVI